LFLSLFFGEKWYKNVGVWENGVRIYIQKMASRKRTQTGKTRKNKSCGVAKNRNRKTKRCRCRKVCK
jgi:hypothetical protein